MLNIPELAAVHSEEDNSEDSKNNNSKDSKDNNSEGSKSEKAVKTEDDNPTGSNNKHATIYTLFLYAVSCMQ